MKGMLHKNQNLTHWKITLGGGEINSEIQIETSCYFGYEYECIKGHRFFLNNIENCKKIIPKMFSNNNTKITRENFANLIVSSSIPIIVQCIVCSSSNSNNSTQNNKKNIVINKNNNTNVNLILNNNSSASFDAQLMRLYFTTPPEKGFQMKLNPKVQINSNKFKYVYDFCSYENDLTLSQVYLFFFIILFLNFVFF